jgi:sugar lactone lactonase YvrE
MTGSLTRFRLTLVVLLPLFGSCCSSGENGQQAPAWHTKLTIRGDFSTPESVLHDPEQDVYFVSNINGDPTGNGAAGFISRVLPDGTTETLKWIDGAVEGTTLNAPKGMVLVGDTLYVTDVTVVRKFHRKSGQHLGDMTIEDTTFLNDLTAGADGTVYVSDTNISGGGTDAIYAISPTGEVKTLAEGDDLGRPNGLLAEEESLLMVNWEGGKLRRITAEGIEDVVTLPENQLDGIVKEKDGSYLISSWAGSCIYRVSPEGEVTEAVTGLNAPADLGTDETRGLVLIPLFKDNRVLAVVP